MKDSTDRLRKTFWVAAAILGLSLLAADLGLGILSLMAGLASGSVALVTFGRLFASEASRQPRTW